LTITRAAILDIRIDDTNRQTAVSNTAIQEICRAITNVLNFDGPMYDTSATSFPPTPDPNPVSRLIGDRTNALYQIIFPITAGGAAVTAGLIADGLLLTGTSNALGTTTDTAALSISDFNNFRLNMIDALNILDQSVRDIVSPTPPSCP